MNKVKHDFNNLVLEHIYVYWERLIAPLSQIDKSVFYLLENKADHQTFCLVVDGSLQVYLNQSEDYLILNNLDWILLNNEQKCDLVARSAWPTQILIIKTKNRESNKTLVEIGTYGQIKAINQIGFWRLCTQIIQETLALDTIHLLIGPSNTWLGANYHCFNQSQRLIAFKLPVNRALPIFKSKTQLILIGLEGTLKIKNDQGFSDWLNRGSIALIQSDQNAQWSLENQGINSCYFLLWSLAEIPDQGILSQICLSNEVWHNLVQLQGTIWSKFSWPILQSAGLNFN